MTLCILHTKMAAGNFNHKNPYFLFLLWCVSKRNEHLYKIFFHTRKVNLVNKLEDSKVHQKQLWSKTQCPKQQL